MNRLLLLAPRIATNRLWARAGEVASFHIAPARTQNAKDLITGSVLGTYNSASPAWAVGPDGVLALPAANAPVIEFDPVTLQCLGARPWGVVTNQLLRSEELDSAAWGKDAATVTANASASPAGSTTADKVVENSTNNFHAISNYVSGFASGDVLTISIYAKAAGRTRFRLQTDASGGAGTADFDLSAVTATAGTGVFSGGSISNAGGGWYRCSVICTCSASGAIGVKVIMAQNNYGVAYLGDGTSGLFLWGGQMQTGSTLGPYVPTTATTASSTADAWDITSLTAGINNLKTLYFRGRTAASGTRGIASLNDNTASNRLELLTSGTTAKATAVTSAATVADLSGGTIAANTTFRLAVRLDADSYALSLNGGAVVTDTSGARALVDRVFIGRDQAGNYMNGYIEEMAGWTRACTDAQVAALAAS